MTCRLGEFLIWFLVGFWFYVVFKQLDFPFIFCWLLILRCFSLVVYFTLFFAALRRFICPVARMPTFLRYDIHIHIYVYYIYRHIYVYTISIYSLIAYNRYTEGYRYIYYLQTQCLWLIGNLRKKMIPEKKICITERF